MMWNIFPVLISHLYIFLGEMSVNIFCPSSNWIVWLFNVHFWEFPMLVCGYKYFLPVYSMSFHPLHMGFCKEKVFHCDEILFINLFYFALRHLFERNENIYLQKKKKNLYRKSQRRFICICTYLYTVRTLRN